MIWSCNGFQIVMHIWGIEVKTSSTPMLIKLNFSKAFKWWKFSINWVGVVPFRYRVKWRWHTLIKSYQIYQQGEELKFLVLNQK
jgi:hypothetical protein